ncbi:Glycosyl transferase family 14 [Arabidopsis thaliana x Arabidopsis arenosa]|uniref:Glycosyl transferase family 14 n=1 Tax=Arabidopsis thaliana x Arabidopsis arenosa TaxID=1240361 RepID=A0A8T1YAV7_9BRAS|nr:Glycosyl transferase family 14 [Arabidopsis thaliana x Arabidopsis arenosa]
MLSPTLFPLFCALFLCLPVAVIFTVQRELTGVISPPEFGFRSLSVFSLYSRNVPDASSSPVVRIRQPIPKEDEPLLRLASRVNPNLPPGSTRKLAFMYLTTSPLPFAPLWEMFFNGSSKNLYNVYVHADPTREYDPPFSGVFLNRVIHSSKPSMRHTPTLTAAARRLVAHALLDDPLNYMFAVISPSCVPIRSFDFTYKTLVSSRKSFIEILKDEPWQFDRWTATGSHAMLPEVKLEEFRIGSQFWVLKRRHARVVARDRRIWVKFNKTCVREDSCYPEESYFSTLLNMRDPRGCVPATLTHVDWTVNDGGHPRMYEPEEVVPELILRLRKTRPRYGEDGINGSEWSAVERMDPFLFARKFSPEALEPLLGMAQTVLFNDSAGGV